MTSRGLVAVVVILILAVVGFAKSCAQPDPPTPTTPAHQPTPTTSVAPSTSVAPTTAPDDGHDDNEEEPPVSGVAADFVRGFLSYTPGQTTDQVLAVLTPIAAPEALADVGTYSRNGMGDTTVTVEVGNVEEGPAGTFTVRSSLYFTNSEGIPVSPVISTRVHRVVINSAGLVESFSEL